MTYHPNLRIITLVSRDDTAAENLLHYLTEHEYPKVEQPDMASQIEHLAQAGQHRLATASIRTFDEYHALQHEFPGSVVLIGIAQARDIERYRAEQDESKPRQHPVEIAESYVTLGDQADMEKELHAIVAESGLRE